MVQHDYILRMIQQLGSFVSGLLHLRESGRAQEAIEQIEDAYGRFAGLSASLVHAISEEDLVQLLRARGSVDPDRTWALAELLREEGLAYDALGQDEEATPRYLKSLRLYLEVLDDVEELPGPIRVDGLEEVIEKIADLELAPSTRRRLVEHLTDTGRYAQAEDLILWNLDRDEHEVGALREAFAFYRRLQAIEPTELERGGLSAEEAREGYARVSVLLDEWDHE